MKTFLFASAVGLVLFVASASASWFLLRPSSSPVPVTYEKPETVTEAGVPEIGKNTEKREQLPVAIRPDLPLSVEAVLELSESIRKKEQELIEREKAVEKSEQAVKLLFEDLKVERAEIMALLDGLEAKLKVANQTIHELKQEHQSLSTQTQELTKLTQQTAAQKGTGDARLDEIGQRVKTAKPWFEGLDDEQAANYLKEFANNGDLRFAARLLKSLQQRKASKILAAFNDPDLVQQILDALAAEDQGQSDGQNRGAAIRPLNSLPR